MAGMKNRTDGMIWIDQISPYRLKYHIHGEDYTVETAVTYKAEVSGHETCPVGTVVKLDSNDKIVPALFPIDLPNVLGVILQTGKTSGTDSASTTEVSIGKSGAIRIPQSDWNKIFVNRDQALLMAQNANSKLAGAPVYWDCGYVEISEDPSTHTRTRNYFTSSAGKLTIQTPSGFKYKVYQNPADIVLNVDPGHDQPNPGYATVNIGYNNLPQVGTISVMHYDGAEADKGYLEINLNFGIFDSTIEWYWPAMQADITNHNNPGLGISDPESLRTLELYHGLFAPTTKHADDINRDIVTIVRCPCQISARVNGSDSTYSDLDLIGNFTHHYNESFTELKYMIPEDLNNVYISGEVIYGFNKN